VGHDAVLAESASNLSIEDLSGEEPREIVLGQIDFSVLAFQTPRNLASNRWVSVVRALALFLRCRRICGSEIRSTQQFSSRVLHIEAVQ
jgi:hypothetical protein